MSDVLSVYTYRLSCLFFFFFFSLTGRSLSPPPAKKSGARSGASGQATTTDGTDEGMSRSSLPPMLLLFSEYNTCHQVQVGNPSTRTLVPRSTVLVPLRFQVELTSSRVNLYQSGVMVAVTVLYIFTMTTP